MATVFTQRLMKRMGIGRYLVFSKMYLDGAKCARHFRPANSAQ
jgi:hypothetical protein